MSASVVVVFHRDYHGFTFDNQLFMAGFSEYANWLLTYLRNTNISCHINEKQWINASAMHYLNNIFKGSFSVNIKPLYTMPGGTVLCENWEYNTCDALIRHVTDYYHAALYTTLKELEKTMYVQRANVIKIRRNSIYVEFQGINIISYKDTNQ